MTGSIAAFKACQAISNLKKASHTVQVVATPSTLNFVGRSTLEGLTGLPLLMDLYEAGHAMDHIHLSREYDVLVLCPATANTINRLAAGLADDLIGALFLARPQDKPYLIFPAMNVEMYQNPIIQKNLKFLESLGVQHVSAPAGPLACGEYGVGRLLEADDIVEMIIKTGPTTQRVLVTYGGTSEPIDDVRSITNRSSGNTGAQIANEFFNSGWHTTVFCSDRAVKSFAHVRRIFDTAKELEQLLEESGNYDAIIHLAAVSDYTLERKPGKISSSNKTLQLELVSTPKLVNAIKHNFPQAKLVAFKLTSGSDGDQAARELMKHSNADFVVQNDIKNLSIKTIYDKNGHKKIGSNLAKELKDLLL